MNIRPRKKQRPLQRIWKWGYPLTLVLLCVPLLCLIGYALLMKYDMLGVHEDAGRVTRTALPKALIVGRQLVQQPYQLQSRTQHPRQILFGDLHTHSTFSWDAFFLNLPIMGGVGSNPPAAACDFARFCAGLDFWGISDHAESVTPRHWRETISALRQCDAISGSNQPDLVSFLGWEWTQAGRTPEQHYGHKNVFFRDLTDVPKRTIAARRQQSATTTMNILLALLDLPNRRRYQDMQRFQTEHLQLPTCDANTPSPKLPEECVELAADPQTLFRKLDAWQQEYLVIPHGTAWGLTTPPGSDFASQLSAQQHNPRRQRLVEVFSGHGNSEEFRAWQEILHDQEGNPTCPPVAQGYLPGCQRAAQLVYDNCMAQEGESDTVCQDKRWKAGRNYIEAGLNQGFTTLPGAQREDWSISDQCADCFQPSFNYIPRGTAQYMLALNRDDKSSSDPLRFRFGFLASSDNHNSIPGTGYKEFARNHMSDARRGPRDDRLRRFFLQNYEPPPLKESVRQDAKSALGVTSLFQGWDRERIASFMYSGGLVAVHSDSREREDIWAALQRREVYGTSGGRILLWFDLVNPPTQPGQLTELPMGAEVRMKENPRFRVHAVGDFQQKPGCPPYVEKALGAERIAALCRGECHNPGSQRLRISRVEVVRIRMPKPGSEESVAERIEDPWKILPCRAAKESCELVFSDPEFADAERDTVYYVRAIQEPTEAINGRLNACVQKNDDGSCRKWRWCDFQDPESDCLALEEERAWASPIFVDYN